MDCVSAFGVVEVSVVIHRIVPVSSRGTELVESRASLVSCVC